MIVCNASNVTSRRAMKRRNGPKLPFTFSFSHLGKHEDALSSHSMGFLLAHTL